MISHGDDWKAPFLTNYSQTKCGQSTLITLIDYHVSQHRIMSLRSNKCETS